MNLFKQLNPLHWLYGILIAITSSLLLVIVMLSAAWDIFNLREDFMSRSDQYASYIRDQLAKNETLLVGFGAFITGTDTLKLDAAKNYADIMLARYPQVTMFQIAQAVSDKNSQTFSEKFGAQLGADPLILDGEGKTHILSDYLHHVQDAFPVIFIAPRSAGSALGLDLRTIDVVKNLLPKSNSTTHPILISEAFELLEGDQAVVMVHPVQRERDQFVVILVVKLNELLPPSLVADKRLQLEIALQEPNSGARVLFSNLKPKTDIEWYDYLLNKNDHFVFADYEVSLKLNRILVPSDLHWGKTFLFLLITLALVILILFMQRLHLMVDRRMEEQRRRLYRAAHFDPLTGLSNRLHFEVAAKKMVATAQQEGEHLVIYFIDLNGFKLINDLQGHESGDAVLRRIGEILKQNLRQDDMAARFGGDEFVVLVKGVRDLNALLQVLEKLRQGLYQPSVENVDTSGLSASIGFSYTGIHGYDYDHLIRVADTSMYGEKHNHYTHNNAEKQKEH